MHTPAYQIDGKAVGRELFYATACDPSRSIVVEACAGAGKTWMLVSRILRALLEGAEPQHILAITFTRKAAGEMRVRLNEWLAEYAAPAADHATRVQALVDRGLSPARAAELAPALGALHERVLASGRQVQVRTFHAWFAQLLRMAPLDVLADMGLQPGMSLMEEPQELETELFRRFQRRVSEDPGLRADFQALSSRHGRALLMDWLHAAWDKRVEIELAEAAGTLANAIAPAAAHYADCVGLDDPLELLQGRPFVEALQALAARLAPSKKKTVAEAGKRLAAALACSNLSERQAQAWAALHTEGGDLRKVLADEPDAQALSDWLRAIDERSRQHHAHQDHGAMVRLSRVLLQEFAQLKRSRGMVDMSDLENLAVRLLGENEWAGWIQERLDARLRHLLIDEFQDTSPLQWHALQPWLASYAGAGGGGSGRQPLSVFIVGDPKQSIYRFRRAEPRVFAAAGDFIVTALDGQRLSCDHTRRNAPGVLTALNTVFGMAQAAGSYAGFRPHTTEVSHPGDGLFCLPKIPKPASQRGGGAEGLVWRDSLSEPRHVEHEHRSVEEARHVANAIAELLATGATRPRDIQVLARRRSVLVTLSEALRALHIPHARADDLNLAEEPEARDLIALLDVLASPGHALSLAQALRSPVFGASDDELLWLADQARACGGNWWQALMTVTGGRPPQLEAAATWLGRWRQLCQVLPPHDVLDRILHEGDVMARMVAAAPVERREHARVVIDSLLAQTLALDGGRYTTPYGFVRALKNRALRCTMTAADDAVRLLTVHGAKGLEAEVVFLMDTDPQRRNADSGTVLVSWPVEAPYPQRVAFVGRPSQRAPSLQALHDEEEQLAALEELNGLYVAITRARRRLVISAIEPHAKGSSTAWWDRLAPLAQLWEPHTPPAAAGAQPLSPPSDGPLAPAPDSTAVWVTDWPAPASDTRDLSRPLLADASASSRAARIGEAFHRLMQWACGSLGPAPGQEGDWLTQALPSAALAFALQDDEATVAQQAAHTVLSSPAFARFRQGPGLLWAGDEVPVSFAGQLLRLDRLVLREDQGQRVWWVLDYKLDPQPETNPDHLAQLARYQAAVQANQPGDRVRGALVSATGRVVVLD